MTAEPSSSGSPRESVREMLARARAERLAWRRGHSVRTQMDAEARRAEVARMTNRSVPAGSGEPGPPKSDEPLQPSAPQGSAWGIVFGLPPSSTPVDAVADNGGATTPVTSGGDAGPEATAGSTGGDGPQQVAPEAADVQRPLMPFESPAAASPAAMPRDGAGAEDASRSTEASAPDSSDPTRPMPLDFRGAA